MNTFNIIFILCLIGSILPACQRIATEQQAIDARLYLQEDQQNFIEKMRSLTFELNTPIQHPVIKLLMTQFSIVSPIAFPVNPISKNQLMPYGDYREITPGEYVFDGYNIVSGDYFSFKYLNSRSISIGIVYGGEQTNEVYGFFLEHYSATDNVGSLFYSTSIDKNGLINGISVRGRMHNHSIAHYNGNIPITCNAEERIIGLCKYYQSGDRVIGSYWYAQSNVAYPETWIKQDMILFTPTLQEGTLVAKNVAKRFSSNRVDLAIDLNLGLLPVLSINYRVPGRETYKGSGRLLLNESDNVRVAQIQGGPYTCNHRDIVSIGDGSTVQLHWADGQADDIFPSQNTNCSNLVITTQ